MFVGSLLCAERFSCFFVLFSALRVFFLGTLVFFSQPKYLTYLNSSNLCEIISFVAGLYQYSVKTDNNSFFQRKILAPGVITARRFAIQITTRRLSAPALRITSSRVMERLAEVC